MAEPNVSDLEETVRSLKDKVDFLNDQIQRVFDAHNELDLKVMRLTKRIEADESEHFYICTKCGQAVDMRDLGQVFHHEEPEHEPL